MRVLSLFDGMSCGQLALKKAGIHVDEYFASEIDKSAIQIAKKNFPNTKHLGSIVDLDTSPAGLALPEIDLVIGGSPCQSFSRSGDNSGFDGKSGLFWEFVRMLDIINPKYFLLENVVMRKEWENIITAEMGVNPVLIDSKHFSAQKRQRLYWTNIPFDQDIIDKGVSLLDIVKGDRTPVESDLVLKIDQEGHHIRNATKKGFLIAEEGDSVNLEVPNSKTRRGRVGKGKTNTLNTACNYGMILNNQLVKLDIEDFERLQTLPLGYTAGVSDHQRKKMIGNGWTADVIAHIFKGLM